MSANTSVNTVLSELNTYIETLRATARELTVSIDNAKGAKQGIDQERDHASSSFVRSTIDSLASRDIVTFDTLSTQAPSTAINGGKSLGYTVRSMQQARAEALQTAESVTGKPLSLASFPTELAQAEGALASLNEKYKPLKDKIIAAEDAVATWKRDPKYKLVKIESEITRLGGPELSPANRSHYERGLIATAWQYYFGPAYFRKAIDALAANKHGENGQDVFADMAAHRTREAELIKQVTTASEEANGLETQLKAAQKHTNSLAALKPRIVGDDKILSRVHETATGYFADNDFCQVAQAQYGEDFPSEIIPLNVKIKAMDKIISGSQSRYDALAKEIQKTADTIAKLQRKKSGARVNVDMDQLRESNKRKSDYYDSCARTSRESWKRAHQYQAPTTVIVHDNSPSFWETMMWQSILNGNNGHHDHYETRTIETTHIEQSAPTVTREQADILGIDKGNADSMGVSIPDFDFDFDTSSPGIDTGSLSDRANSSFGRTGGSINDFDFEVSEPATSTATFTPPDDDDDDKGSVVTESFSVSDTPSFDFDSD